ncbi:MAG: MarR family transcriptional regulator [bacterium]|nr:MarR family transcriptional regulator [Acidimicrobiia bacterium]MCY4650080.1 MarR family transcriptional regulator [bacterium]
MERNLSEKKEVVAAWLNRLPAAGVGIAVDYQQSYGLSYVDAKALELLYGAPLGPRQLAEKLQMSPAGITKLVDRLERRGLVKRRRHPADRRRSLVFITDKALVSSFQREQVRELIERAVDDATEKQLEVLYDFLQELGRGLLSEGLIKS